MPKKFVKILFLIIFIQFFCYTLLLIPISVNAKEVGLGEKCTSKDTCKKGSCIKGVCAIFVPNVTIPGSNFKKGEAYNDFGTTKPIAEYIEAIYKYAIGAVAILATVVMMIGGVVWITAGGSQNRIGEAKQWISGSLTGMVLVLCSYMILNTVNPDLVKFKPIGIETVNKIITGACRISALSNDFSYTCENGMEEEDCLKQGVGYEWLKDEKCPTVCCAWDLHVSATALNGGTRLYENCDDTRTNLSETGCKNKAGDLTFYQYSQNGYCNKRTLIGTDGTLISYQCINR